MKSTITALLLAAWVGGGLTFGLGLAPLFSTGLDRETFGKMAQIAVPFFARLFLCSQIVLFFLLPKKERLILLVALLFSATSVLWTGPMTHQYALSGERSLFLRFHGMDLGLFYLGLITGVILFHRFINRKNTK